MFYLRKLEFDSSVTIISLCVLEKPWHTHFYRSYSHVKLKFYTSYRHVDKVITLLHMHSFHHYLAENTHFHIFETGPPGITFHLCCHLLITLWHTKKYYIFAHTHTYTTWFMACNEALHHWVSSSLWKGRRLTCNHSVISNLSPVCRRPVC